MHFLTLRFAAYDGLEKTSSFTKYQTAALHMIDKKRVLIQQIKIIFAFNHMKLTYHYTLLFVGPLPHFIPYITDTGAHPYFYYKKMNQINRKHKRFLNYFTNIFFHFFPSNPIPFSTKLYHIFFIKCNHFYII